MTNGFHLHDGAPCWRTTCPQAEEKGRPWTEEELAKEGFTRLGLEALGICPASGESFVQCIRGPCDCFMTLGNVEDYIRGCREELSRQTAKRRAQYKETPHKYTGNTSALSMCSWCGMNQMNPIHAMGRSA